MPLNSSGQATQWDSISTDEAVTPGNSARAANATTKNTAKCFFISLATDSKSYGSGNEYTLWIHLSYSQANRIHYSG